MDPERVGSQTIFAAPPVQPEGRAQVEHAGSANCVTCTEVRMTKGQQGKGQSNKPKMSVKDKSDKKKAKAKAKHDATVVLPK